MRSHGVSDFPDPTVGSNGLPSWTSSGTQAPADQPQAPAYRAAQRVCKKDLPNIGPHTSAEKAATDAAALKYANCMRSNGVPNFPDPNGHGAIQIQEAPGVLDESSPQFQKAETACKSLDNGFAEQSSTAVSSP
jgi:hypothetical protein